MTDYTCIVLPFPPTTNNLFTGKARRYPSKQYRAWKQEAGFALMQQKPLPSYATQVALKISLGIPDMLRRDVSNYIKAVEDLLVTHGVLADDSLVHDLRVRWDAEVTGARVEIEAMGVGK